ncbi:MAG TPA: hypothetical protein VLK82_05145 [Candidatus Tectomicrobia bacterium]|nr:hypothetical protein [Candidatus Tectomicrobia bacterium]
MSIPQVLQILGERHSDMTGRGFALLANVRRITADAPYEVAPNVFLRKATSAEAITLRELITLTSFNLSHSTLSSIGFRNPYETSCEATVIETGVTSRKTYTLPEVEWRYHVADFEGTNDILYRFVETTMLTPWRLHLGVAVLDGSGGRGQFAIVSDPAQDRAIAEANMEDDVLLTLGLPELDELRYVYSKTEAHSDSRVNLHDAMQRFAQLDTIPAPNALLFLGYISILESLLTHKPDPKDPYDSLTRQVRQKMLLLGKRFARPLPYESCFGLDLNHAAKIAKIWTKLYDYRSSLAHGGHADFKQRLQLLKSPSAALDFIKVATVSTMRQALEEPDLVADLRAC